MCGISDHEDEIDMTLMARRRKRTIKKEGLRYMLGDEATGQYDACFYEIQVDEVLTDDQIKQMRGNYDELRIYFNLTRSENMNIYLYGGQSRDEAKESIVAGNVPPQVA